MGSHQDDSEDADIKPLILGSLPGKQELVLRFVDTGKFSQSWC